MHLLGHNDAFRSQVPMRPPILPRRASSSNRPNRHPPRIEILENRHLLSATITVDTIADTDARNDVLSLREAIEVANGQLSASDLSPRERAQVQGDPAGQAPNRIDFSIPGEGVRTI